MVTTAMVNYSLVSLVDTPAGGRRPGARSPAAVGPEKNRDQGGPSLPCPAVVNGVDIGQRAREVDRTGRSPSTSIRQGPGRWLPGAFALRPPPGPPPGAGSNPPEGTRRVGATRLRD